MIRYRGNDMDKLQEQGRKAILPLVLIISLFFLWALANNLNDVLIGHFKKTFTLNDLQSGLVQSAFYAGYFFLAMPAAFFMRRFGYKAAVVLGLCLYGLPSNDVHAILTRIPNGFGLTLVDMLNADKARLNMTAAAQAGLVDPKRAKEYLEKCVAIDKETRESINTKLQEIADLAETSRNGKPPEPNFDFKKLAETATPMKKVAVAS